MAKKRNNGSCPVCTQTVNVPPGGTVPLHQQADKPGTCPGSGQAAN